MSTSPTPSNPEHNPIRQAVFDPSAAHLQRPALRPVRGFPMQAGVPQGAESSSGQQPPVMLGLADARQISDKICVLPLAAQFVLPLMDGTRTLEEITSAVGRGLTVDILKQIVAQLDDAGLLVGPTFEAMLSRMRADFDAAPHLPPASTQAFGEMLASMKLGQEASAEERASKLPELMRAQLDEWIAEALKDAAQPSLDELPAGVIVPHIDYPRGWINYASVWGRMRVVDRPDRVVILGTNHFGMGTGVTACDKGYQTPLGLCELDRGLLEAVRRRLGAEASKLLEHRYDHEREHSIELQVPWIQHVLGKDESGRYVPVLGFLVHDPSTNGGESYDGKGLGLDRFVEALRGAIEEVGGKTLVVSSADLSHVGPMFGDPQALAGDDGPAKEARDRVLRVDQEMLGLVVQAKPDDLVAAMAWQQNPTRWCSIGNIVAMLKTVRPERVELLQYMAAMDPQGQGMVSSIGAVAR